jgi:hypothetical protein
MQVPAAVVVEIPVCYSLGINEKKFAHGAYVRLRFFEVSVKLKTSYSRSLGFIRLHTLVAEGLIQLKASYSLRPHTLCSRTAPMSASASSRSA